MILGEIEGERVVTGILEVTRQLAHELIDRMPETQLSDLVRFLEAIVDPVGGALRNAPLDDEGESEEGKIAVDDAMRRLGLW